MLKMTVKAIDLFGIYNIHRAALGYGMFYRKPYRGDGQILGAEGTVFVLSSDTLVACTMATRHRMIIHTRIPCTNVDNNDGALFALEAPKEFDRVLRRFGDKLLELTGDGSRLEIVLPRPKNARGMISLPMERVNGRMLSVTCPQPTATVCLDADLLIAAMKRVPRGRPWDLLTTQLCDAGVEFRYSTNGTIGRELLPAQTVRNNDATTPCVCSTTRVAGLLRVLKCLPKHGRNVQVQISASRIAFWNDSVTVQFFADRVSSESSRLSTPGEGKVTSAIKLVLDPGPEDLPNGTAKWLRQLVRRAIANSERAETSWILSRKQTVVQLNCGIQT